MPEAKTWLVYAMSGIFAVLLVVAPPILPLWLRVTCWVVLAEIFVYWVCSHSHRFRRIRAGAKARTVVTLLWIILAGAAVGAVAAPVVWLLLPADEEGPGDDALELRYRAMGLTKTTLSNSLMEGDAFVVVHCEFTKRSEKNMSLWFIMMAQIPLEGGGHTAAAANGEWKNDVADPKAVSVLNIGRESTVSGILFFRFQGPKFLREVGEPVDFEKWEDIPTSKFRLRVEDKVSGVFVLCGPYGYPSATAGFTMDKPGDGIVPAKSDSMRP